MSELQPNFKQYISYCIDNNIEKIIMFIKDDKSILEMKSYINKQSLSINLIAVTFPANEKMYVLNEHKNVERYVPESADGDTIKNILKQNNITLISSSLPFEGIVIPGDNFNPYKIIEQTFNIVNPGLPSLIQSLLIATDNGVVIPKERVLVMNSRLAIDVLGTNTRFLFHPKDGMEINKIIQ